MVNENRGTRRIIGRRCDMAGLPEVSGRPARQDSVVVRPMGVEALPWPARLVVTPSRPADGRNPGAQPPTRCSVIDSPTTTQRELETQLTPDRGWADPTTAGCLQGWLADPVRITSPAWAAVATELPAETHEPTDVQDTSLRAAAMGVTNWFVQLAPPLLVVRTNPCPVPALFRVVAVVPTTVQTTPATPAAGALVVVVATVVDVLPGAVSGAVGVVFGVLAEEVKGSAPLPLLSALRQEMPLRYPVPAGMGSMDHRAPPSVVTATTPVTWSTSTDVCAVTQQCWSSEHDTAVAPDTLAGSVPAWVHPEVGVAETKATTPPVPAPVAIHRRSGRQVTAVISRTPGGVGDCVHVIPPFDVPMITACPFDVWLAWPTAVHWRWSLQAIPER